MNKNYYFDTDEQNENGVRNGSNIGAAYLELTFNKFTHDADEDGADNSESSTSPKKKKNDSETFRDPDRLDREGLAKLKAEILGSEIIGMSEDDPRYEDLSYDYIGKIFHYLVNCPSIRDDVREHFSFGLDSVCLRCASNYNPEKGDFFNYIYGSVSKKIQTYKKRSYGHDSKKVKILNMTDVLPQNLEYSYDEYADELCQEYASLNDAFETDIFGSNLSELKAKLSELFYECRSDTRDTLAASLTARMFGQFGEDMSFYGIDTLPFFDTEVYSRCVELGRALTNEEVASFLGRKSGNVSRTFVGFTEKFRAA